MFQRSRVDPGREQPAYICWQGYEAFKVASLKPRKYIHLGALSAQIPTSVFLPKVWEVTKKATQKRRTLGCHNHVTFLAFAPKSYLIYLGSPLPYPPNRQTEETLSPDPVD